MLHHIKLPPYGDILEQFVQFQRQLLVFCCTETLSHPLKETVVKNSFPDYRGEWLWKKLWRRNKQASNLANYLVDLSTYIQGLPDEQFRIVAKNDILEAFDYDIAFYKHMDSIDFHFAYFHLSDSLRKFLKPLMTYCYDLLCQGFPIQKTITDITYFTRDDLVEAFKEHNKKMLTVCPACDGQRPLSVRKAGKKNNTDAYEDERSEKTYADVDHFFPRSLYPFLSIHALNLVPTCKTCNESLKGDTDPINHQARQTLEDIFHPYKRPAVDDIIIQIISAARNASEVHIAPAPHATGKHAASRIENLNRVLHLEDTWSGSYMDDVLAGIDQHLRDIRRRREGNQQPIESNLINEHLEMIRCNASEKIGTQQYYLLQRSYANYALVNDDEYNYLKSMFLGLESAEETQEVASLVETVRKPNKSTGG